MKANAVELLLVSKNKIMRNPNTKMKKETSATMTMGARPYTAFLLIIPLLSRTHAFLVGGVVRSNGKICRNRTIPPLATKTNKASTSMCRMEGCILEEGVSRADAVQTFVRAALVAGASVVMNGAVPSACEASRSANELAKLIGEARRQLDPVDKLITEAKWDAIRNIIKTYPLADMKNVISELSRQCDEQDSGALLGMRQDVLDHIQFLDSFSYNNVFVGEERQILGTKIDYDTPRFELSQCREALDTIMEIAPPSVL